MSSRQRPPVLRGIASLLLLVQLAACTSWRAQSGPPGEVVLREKPERVRVSRSEGLKITLEGVTATADSLIGMRPTGDDPMARRRVAIAVADITRIELRKVSALRTTALVVGIGAGLFIIAMSTMEIGDFGPIGCVPGGFCDQ